MLVAPRRLRKDRIDLDVGKLALRRAAQRLHEKGSGGRAHEGLIEEHRIDAVGRPVVGVDLRCDIPGAAAHERQILPDDEVDNGGELLERTQQAERRKARQRAAVRSHVLFDVFADVGDGELLAHRRIVGNVALEHAERRVQAHAHRVHPVGHVVGGGAHLREVAQHADLGRVAVVLQRLSAQPALVQQRVVAPQADRLNRSFEIVVEQRVARHVQRRVGSCRRAQARARGAVHLMQRRRMRHRLVKLDERRPFAIGHAVAQRAEHAVHVIPSTQRLVRHRPRNAEVVVAEPRERCRRVWRMLVVDGLVRVQREGHGGADRLLQRGVAAKRVGDCVRHVHVLYESFELQAGSWQLRKVALERLPDRVEERHHRAKRVAIKGLKNAILHHQEADEAQEGSDTLLLELLHLAEQRGAQPRVELVAPHALDLDDHVLRLEGRRVARVEAPNVMRELRPAELVVVEVNPEARRRERSVASRRADRDERAVVVFRRDVPEGLKALLVDAPRAARIVGAEVQRPREGGRNERSLVRRRRDEQRGAPRQGLNVQCCRRHRPQLAEGLKLAGERADELLHRHVARVRRDRQPDALARVVDIFRHVWAADVRKPTDAECVRGRQFFRRRCREGRGLVGVAAVSIGRRRHEEGGLQLVVAPNHGSDERARGRHGGFRVGRGASVSPPSAPRRILARDCR